MLLSCFYMFWESFFNKIHDTGLGASRYSWDLRKPEPEWFKNNLIAITLAENKVWKRDSISSLDHLSSLKQWERILMFVSEKPKPKYYLPAVSSRVNITRSQWEFKLKTNKLTKARENRSEHVAIDSSLASNWLRERREFSWTITGRNAAK